ncbi:hypothetical protein ACFT38_27805 [Streptomyces sp. NPDC056975]|uniref:hypothetical protein n=1 Tax=Streptomyces sp. NPDC056975 TaxID=3345985 RepID=UPI00363F2948
MKLREEITALWHEARTTAGVDAVTFTVIGQMPDPAREFYSNLIDATECLDEMIAAHDPMYIEGRHGPLVLIGDALGVLQVDHLRAQVEACCRVCRHQVADRTHEAGDAGAATDEALQVMDDRVHGRAGNAVVVRELEKLLAAQARVRLARRHVAARPGTSRRRSKVSAASYRGRAVGCRSRGRPGRGWCSL